MHPLKIYQIEMIYLYLSVAFSRYQIWVQKNADLVKLFGKEYLLRITLTFILAVLIYDF